MIKHLEITDFQCHKHFAIDFDPAITVIVGSSDRGKSSIIRALRWASLNQPRGDGFTRDGAKGVSVKVVFDDHEIIRERTANKNQYILDNGVPFEALGGGKVPDPIQAIVNVGDVNFSLQHDPIFWFSLTAGELSKELNKVVALDQIDSSLASIAAELKLAKTTITVTEKRFYEAEAKLKILEWTTEADTNLTALETVESNLAELKQRKSKLQNAITSLEKYDQEIELNVAKSNELIRLVGVAESLKVVTEKLEGLANLISKIQESDKLIKVKLPTKELLAIDKLIDVKEELKERYNKLVCLISSVKTADSLVSETSSLAVEAQNEFQEQLKGECPLCQQPLPSSPLVISTFD